MNQEPDTPANPQRPRIRLSRNGPYLVTVDDLTNSKGERLEGRHGIALCRCGASQKKPFCDSSHIRIGFSDEPRPGPVSDGAVGWARHAPSDPAASPPRIRIARNGPYEVEGFDLAITNWPEGVSRERYALCRCGGSKNKPFCDGTHERIGFRDDRN